MIKNSNRYHRFKRRRNRFLQKLELSRIAKLKPEIAFERYGHLCKMAASKYQRLKVYDFDLLKSFAYEGFLIKYPLYDYKLGVPFEPYIVQAMKWYIMDRIREVYGRDLGKTFYKEILTEISDRDSSFTDQQNDLSKIELNIDLETALNTVLEGRDLVMFMSYLRGKTLFEIGKDYDVSQSRISQIINKSKTLLKKYCLKQR